VQIQGSTGAREVQIKAKLDGVNTYLEKPSCTYGWKTKLRMNCSVYVTSYIELDPSFCSG